MKVLHVISGGDSGGAKTHLFNLITELEKYIDTKIVCFIPGEFYVEAKKLGYKVVLIEQKSRFDLKVANAIVKMVQEENFNLVHCHGARANFVGLFVKNKIRVPMLTTVHSDFNKDFEGTLYKKLFFTTLNKIALKKFDYYEAVSEDLKKLLIKHHVDSNKIFLLNNGISFDRTPDTIDRATFLKKYSVKCSLNDKWVGIIARFDPVKGHSVFINAAVEVLKTNPDTTFLLAGDGTEKESILNQIEQSGFKAKIVWLGFCKEALNLLSLLDINVLTSFTEGLPYVVLESAVTKTVMVSSEVGAIPLLIKDGHSGFLFKPGDYMTLAKHLVTLLNDENMRKTMGENLYNIALEDFSVDAMVKKQISIYENILGK
jgi:glycosyltransferase involved in cell wall biosynthesis